jgi:hypothetical protein
MEWKWKRDGLEMEEEWSGDRKRMEWKWNRDRVDMKDGCSGDR